MGEITVIVCGGRSYGDGVRMYRVLDAFHKRWVIGHLVHGGANGADKMSGEWASSRNVRATEVKADWKRQGPAAGPIRNQRMLDTYRPDAIIAFPGGRGTADMVRRGEAAGVRIFRIP